MFPFLSKFSFLRKKPKLIITVGENTPFVEAMALDTLQKFFKVEKITLGEFSRKKILKNEILFLPLSKDFKARRLKFWTRHSLLPICLVTNLDSIPPEDIVFASQRNRDVLKLVKFLPPFAYLILNYDDETVREIGDNLNVRRLTFGFGENADFRVTNYHIDEDGINFKLNFKGNILPIWLKNLFGKDYVYASLGTLAIGAVLNLNLINLSQDLKEKTGVQGKGQMLRGINDSLILDNTRVSSIASVIEGLDALNEIALWKKKEEFWGGKKIAVLGDVLNIGKYTIEAHETLGEKVAERADMVLAVGERALFIAKEVRERNVSSDRVFHFYETSKAISFLKNRVKKNDIVLVAGSTEMKMEDIVEAIEKEIGSGM